MPQLSERAEYVAECLAVALELTPLLNDDERAQLAQLHPFATSYWLDSLVASGKGQATQDTQLIAQLSEQLRVHAERERQLLDELEDEREQSANASAAAATAAAAAAAAAADRRRPSSQASSVRPSSPRGSPRGSQAARPPKSSKGAPRRAAPPSPRSLGDTTEAQAQAPPDERHAGGSNRRAPPQQQHHRSPPRDEMYDDDDGDGGESGTIPWNEFAGDDEGGVVGAESAEEAEEMDRRRRERSESRFDSISEEIKALNAGLVGAHGESSGRRTVSAAPPAFPPCVQRLPRPCAWWLLSFHARCSRARYSSPRASTDLRAVDNRRSRSPPALWALRAQVPA